MNSHSKVLLLGVLLAVLPVAQAEPVRLPGKFVWGELVTDDLKASTRFYGAVFGWSFQVIDDYIMAFNGEEPVGGIFYHARPQHAAAKPRWFGYISVDDLHQTETTVLAAGGTVRAPLRKLPGQDSEAIVFADPEGALFGVVRAADGDPEDYLAETGSWIWIQLLARDVRQAGNFYQRVAGYATVDNGRINGQDRLLLTRDGYARAAVMAISPQRQDVAPLWLPFIRVDNVAATIARAQQAGGAVLLQPRPDLFAGRVAVIADPAQAAIGIMEWDAEPETGAPTETAP